MFVTCRRQGQKIAKETDIFQGGNAAENLQSGQAHQRIAMRQRLAHRIANRARLGARQEIIQQFPHFARAAGCRLRIAEMRASASPQVRISPAFSFQM